ncbi:hypothetical protein ACP0HM_28085 [Escherichia coli]
MNISRSKWGLIVGNRAHSLLSPVFQQMFGWKESNHTMRSLTEGNALLSKAVVDSLDDQSNGRYRFGADWKPFTHQLASWKALLEKETFGGGNQWYGFR